MASILIADSLQDGASLKRILDGYEQVVVNTMKAARAKLQKRSFDLIVVTLHFDDSRMFDLMREVRRCSNNFNKPIICFCARDTRAARLMHESLQVITRVLGAWMYLNEHEYNIFKNPDDELKRVIERCLAAESRGACLKQRRALQKRRQEIHELRVLMDLQGRSADTEEYFVELTQGLQTLREEVHERQLLAASLRASIELSRDRKDRVSRYVISHEDAMTRLEKDQSSMEASQTACEDALLGKVDSD